MYADLALDNRILRDVIEKTLEPEIKKQIVVEIVEEYELSIARGVQADGDPPFVLLLSGEAR